MTLKQKILMAILGAGLTLGGVSAASATPWQASHPLRAEVNHRLAHQHMRIHRALYEGRIAASKAAYLHHEDRVIRHQERRDAAAHGGHITRGEQARLNHEENHVSRQIAR